MEEEQEEDGEEEEEEEEGTIQPSLLDLPEALLTHIVSLITDTRTRNSLSLVSTRLLHLDRLTRSSLSLRGNLRHLPNLPLSLPLLSSLDLSLLSPYGHPISPTSPLLNSFPNISSLTLYSRHPSLLHSLLPGWSHSLRHLSLVRWHQRPPDLPPGSDLLPVLISAPNLSSLDLSSFYCWSEDIPAALTEHPPTNLTTLNLLSRASPDGFRAEELLTIVSSCPNLTHFLAPCQFNPRCFDFVSDDTLLQLPSRLVQLHLTDPARDDDGELDARVTCFGLERLFAQLPRLEDFALDIGHRIQDAGPALEVMGNRCPKMRRLKVGMFRGICRAAGLHLDGVSVCGGLTELCVKNAPDLTDKGLVCIARGCRRLSRVEISGCWGVTAAGVGKMAEMLKSTLVDVSLSRCEQIDAKAGIGALEPIRDRIERIRIDCIWKDDNNEHVDLDDDDDVRAKRCKYSNGCSSLYKTWDRLKYLSVWLPAGVTLGPLPEAGLEDCPELEEICIKIEGDCRAKPTEQVFNISCLTLYPKLSKMKLDCGDATGYALTAPNGQMDLSFWERFYLSGIGSLSLYELDYWPPQDKDVNQRSLSLPATGLIQECSTLRKLFIHGTMHEHFMRFFLAMPRLRDVQLREDYYPAPEDDMSTEMRVDSCSRFEDALNSRGRVIPD